MKNVNRPCCEMLKENCKGCDNAIEIDGDYCHVLRGYKQGRTDAIEEFLAKSEFMRGYKFDSGKLSGVSLGECLDEIAKWVNSQKEVDDE